MENLIASFKKLTGAQKALGVGGAAALIALGAYFLFISDDISKAAELDDKIVVQEKQLAELSEQANNLNQYKRVVEQLKIQLRQAEEQLPKKAEVEKLLRDVAFQAQQSGLQQRRFRLGAEVKEKDVARVPVEMEVSGGYHELAVFFNSLSKMRRIVTVSNLEMRTPNIVNNKVILTARYRLETYRFIEQEEAK